MAISPLLAMKSVLMGVGGEELARDDPMNASNASDATRHRPPTRLAGRDPRAIQRWTDRVVAPIRAAAWLGLNSSGIGGAIVACPHHVASLTRRQ